MKIVHRGGECRSACGRRARGLPRREATRAHHEGRAAAARPLVLHWRGDRGCGGELGGSLKPWGTSRPDEDRRGNAALLSVTGAPTRFKLRAVTGSRLCARPPSLDDAGRKGGATSAARGRGCSRPRKACIGGREAAARRSANPVVCLLPRYNTTRPVLPTMRRRAGRAHAWRDGAWQAPPRPRRR